MDIEEPRHWYGDRFGLVLASGGLIAGAVGAGLFVNASHLRHDAEASPSQQEHAALNDKADTRALAGTVVVIGGGVLLVTAVIHMALYDRQSSPSGTAVGLTVGVSSNGAFVTGRF